MLSNDRSIVNSERSIIASLAYPPQEHSSAGNRLRYITSTFTSG
jgi:hypothetical protein